MLIQTDITINAPIDRVFEVFSDLEKATERIDGIVAIEILEGPAQMAVGTKWKETRIMFGKEATEEMYVTEVNRNRNYVVEAENHGMKYRTEYTFTETPDGVQVKLVFGGEPVNMFARLMDLFTRFMSKTVEDMLHQDMLDLKKVCEEG